MLEITAIQCLCKVNDSKVQSYKHLLQWLKISIQSILDLISVTATGNKNKLNKITVNMADA
jgi:hypothetical protein